MIFTLKAVGVIITIVIAITLLVREVEREDRPMREARSACLAAGWPEIHYDKHSGRFYCISAVGAIDVDKVKR